jgi:hypothetical protein
MLFQSGNLEVQELNTGGRGYKIAPMTGAKSYIPVMGKLGADNALRARVGGEEVLKQLQGLQIYTDIDYLGSKEFNLVEKKIKHADIKAEQEAIQNL